MYKVQKSDFTDYNAPWQAYLAHVRETKYTKHNTGRETRKLKNKFNLKSVIFKTGNKKIIFFGCQGTEL
jgi:hypothetical protein